MILRYFLVTLALASLGAAHRMILEDAPVIPTGWRKVHTEPNPNQQVRLAIALRQPDIDNAGHRLRKRSESETGFLSFEEAQALQNPDPKDVRNVMTWLGNNGLKGQASADKDWIHVITSVVKAELLLGMALSVYQFRQQPPVLRTREYSVPKSVFESIDFIYPLTNFMTPKRDLTSTSHAVAPGELAEMNLDEVSDAAKRDAFCNPVVTPSCLRKLYNIHYKPGPDSPIRLGVAGFLEENANYADSDAFLKSMAPRYYKANYNYSIEVINGAVNSQDLWQSGGEAGLDLQYALGLGYPAKIVYYLTGGRGMKLNDQGIAEPASRSTNEPYLEFLQHLLSKPDSEIPHVLSISYADDELSVPTLYAQRVCQLFGVLAARGTTILAASGDGGAKGSSNSNCRTNDGSNRDVAMAVFPATCPWVTSVGAVSNQQEPPQAAGYSGGGFSQIFMRERWQDAAVDSYVGNLNGRMSGYYNASYRAVPDISAVGTSFAIVQSGYRTSLQGTSASTPVIASMIALINDARVRKGKPLLGWLNPRLYSSQVQEVLQDITKGDSYPCQFRGPGGPAGWPATKGYDAVTGLGVPSDFAKLFKVLVNMP